MQEISCLLVPSFGKHITVEAKMAV